MTEIHKFHFLASLVDMGMTIRDEHKDKKSTFYRYIFDILKATKKIKPKLTAKELKQAKEYHLLEWNYMQEYFKYKDTSLEYLFIAIADYVTNVYPIKELEINFSHYHWLELFAEIEKSKNKKVLHNAFEYITDWETRSINGS